ncbi:uncharacterized protein LOC114828090 [Galendromus occidentalis]|uniref:Uncharacterized protein LOC114828090 n=1 Tax=Galendromus occidentalis TaxID=34638 RepID=A0AAJ7WHZ4_9ACAR|nr:uncharacterized protein LOC114828090 [Galendromus occidentalis]
MEEFSQDLSVALEEANQQDSDSCTEQVMQKPRRPRRRRPRKDINVASPVSRSEGGSPERPRRAKRPPRMQVEAGAGSLECQGDCQMVSVSSSSSDVPSECGGCCGCSSEADDEQTDFPHNEPPPPKIKAIQMELAPPSTHQGVALTNEFRRRVHSAGNRSNPGCSEQGRKRRRRCCPIVNPVLGSPSVSDSPPAGIKLHKGSFGFPL